MDEDRVTQEFVVIPIKRGAANASKDKLVGQSLRVIEFELDGPMTDEVLNEGIIRKFGIPAMPTSYLAIPLDEANIVNLKPTVDAQNHPFDSYRSL